MRSLLIGLLVTSVSVMAGSAGISEAKLRKGDRAGELVGVTDGKGKKVLLKPLKSKVVVVTFGASWCPPCKSELPALEKLAAKYAEEKIVFIAINIDGEREKGVKFMREAGLSRVVAAFDTKKGSVDHFDPPTMPSTFIIRKGVVRHVHTGYRKGDDKKLDKVIASELKRL